VLATLKRACPAPLKGVMKALAGPLFWGRRSFSQEGEDLALERLLETQSTGFYVDVGAHHPFKWSNTYALYRRGWRGINVDPNPGCKARFDQWRPRDINLECGVGIAEGQSTLFVFSDPLLNTFDSELARQRDGVGSWRIVQKIGVQVRTLANILRDHVPNEVTDVDVLCVDVEGRDYEVLESSDWERFRPRYVVVEEIGVSIREALRARPTKLLESLGYELTSKLVNSLIFQRLPGSPDQGCRA
jgi:FkbM family methyltransferase